MNAMGLAEPDVRTLWTRQDAAVEKELEREGVYRVKEEYIRKKNDTISDFYLRLYKWYTREAKRYISFEGEYPIWLSITDEMMLQPTEGAVILKVEIPADQYILCNYDAWGYVVNYFYVPIDDKDREEHQEKLRRYGIATDDELLLTDKGNFYPLLKRELFDSWKRVFTQNPKSAKEGLVATAWEIRREWVKEIRHYGD